jgi:lambda repressor-like predicted transcriptional regulator
VVWRRRPASLSSRLSCLSSSPAAGVEAFFYFWEATCSLVDRTSNDRKQLILGTQKPAWHDQKRKQQSQERTDQVGNLTSRRWHPLIPLSEWPQALALLKQGVSLRQVAAQFGVSYESVRHVQRAWHELHWHELQQKGSLLQEEWS